MTQGIFDSKFQRIISKKQLKEFIKQGEPVVLEATSVFGNEFDGVLQFAPDGDYWVVGPDPYRSRKWFAHIVKEQGKVTVK